MEGQFSRTELLLGTEALEKLKKSKVIVFGIGGVGGYVVESLVRSGVGQIDVVDNDVVCLSNLNRQLIATRDTVGEKSRYYGGKNSLYQPGLPGSWLPLLFFAGK